MTLKNYALISCYDKTNLDLLIPQFLARGWNLLATGGSYTHIKNLGFPVTEVSELTGKAEIFGGRVKTLQYEILGSILLRVGKDEKEWPHDFRISAVVCNFYPFQEKAKISQNMDELVEWIDIGGPTMVRSAAKNYKDVFCFTHPRQYQYLKESSFENELKVKEELALEAFDLIHELDRRIAFELHSRLKKELRYGENPHQKAVFLSDKLHESMGDISFNNIRDAEGALKFILPFHTPAVGVVKHGTLCGAAVSMDEENTPFDNIFEEAWEGDTVSRFGGIISFNRAPNQKIFDILSKRFVEVLVLPNDPESKAWAIEFFKIKAQCKIFLCDLEGLRKKELESFGGAFGTLIQERDESKFSGKTQDLETFFSLWTAACSKSNAITLVGKDEKKKLFYLAGAGQGQPNRIESLQKLALPRAEDFCNRRGYNKAELICSSDAFFPFDDILHVLNEAGIKKVLQPGGSKNDPLVVETAKKLEMNMTFTQERHFWH